MQNNAQFSGNIFIIGDSHVEAFTGLTGVNQHFIYPGDNGKPGHPGTMYVIGRDNGTSIIAHEKFGLHQERDAMVFSFGHIDANWLIWTQINEKQRELDEVIETLVNKYLNAITDLTKKEIIRIIYNIIPPSNYGSIHTFVGTLTERIKYSKKLNQVLVTECAARQMEFLDVYDHYCDENGMLNVN